MDEGQTLPNHEWLCHDCKFRATSLGSALDHPWSAPENFGHWLYEHPEGSRYKPPTREIHSSDHGGCYLSPVSHEEARDLVKRFRASFASDAFR